MRNPRRLLPVAWAIALALASCSQPASSPSTSAPLATATPIEPSTVEATTTILCGTFMGNDHVSNPAIYELVSPTGASVVRFASRVDLRSGKPAVGDYMCAQFRSGSTPFVNVSDRGPTNTVFVSMVVSGEPGYIAKP